jgi:hypothetical protein
MWTDGRTDMTKRTVKITILRKRLQCRSIFYPVLPNLRNVLPVYPSGKSNVQMKNREHCWNNTARGKPEQSVKNLPRSHLSTTNLTNQQINPELHSDRPTTSRLITQNYIYVYIYTHTHTYIYIYTHTHIYIYTHTYRHI